MSRSKRSGRPPRPRRAGALALLGGLVCLALAAAVFAGIPDTLAEERAYASARPCPTAAPLPDEDCLRDVPYTVVDAKADGGRSSGYWASLTNQAGRTRVDFSGGEPLASHLRKGEPVTARVWRGGIMAVSWHSLTQATREDPDGNTRWGVLLGLVLTAGGVFGLWSGWWLLRHTEDYLAGRTRPLAVAGWCLTGVPALIPVSWAGSVFLAAPPWYRIVLSAAFLAVAGKWLLPAVVRRRPSGR
ncbi:hypothetical protein [Streptomyces sp. NPDC091371]|uniref:hypothetical protein n=1 Tax=Streptomyces sp. NPDC091371 TaxID=3155303 RepID=UPI0034483621